MQTIIATSMMRHKTVAIKLDHHVTIIRNVSLQKIIQQFDIMSRLQSKEVISHVPSEFTFTRLGELMKDLSKQKCACDKDEKHTESMRLKLQIHKLKRLDMNTPVYCFT